MTSRYSLVGLLGLALVLAGSAWMLFQSESGNLELAVTNESRDDGRTETHGIVLTEDGYKPDALSINQGDAVVFSTTRDAYHWPASNLHPTHGIYPAFDPEQPIPADEEWTFTFEQEGTWRMHDHLAPYFTGVITVN